MDASVRKTDKLIVQYGTSLGERADCDLVTLSKVQGDNLEVLLAAPNGGVTLNADGSLTALAVPAPVNDARAVKVARLRTLQAKGWAAMTLLERDEASSLVFELR